MCHLHTGEITVSENSSLATLLLFSAQVSLFTLFVPLFSQPIPWGVRELQGCSVYITTASRIIDHLNFISLHGKFFFKTRMLISINGSHDIIWDSLMLIFHMIQRGRGSKHRQIYMYLQTSYSTKACKIWYRVYLISVKKPEKNRLILN